MMGLFSLLFGAGIVLFIESAQKRSHPSPRRLSLWRNLLLLIFGLIHLLLIWKGDVLALYAICAPIVIFLYKRRIRLLIAISAICMISPIILSVLLQQFFDANGNLIEALTDDNANKTWNIGLGKFWFAEKEKMVDMIGLFFIADGFCRALGMMLLGVVLYRLNVLQGHLNSKIYRRMALFGLVIGIPITLASTAWMIYAEYDPEIALIGWVTAKLGIVPLVLAYIGIFSLLNKKISNKIASRIRACGKMAFTNYLSQSILGVLMFTVIFQKEDFTRKEIVIFVFAIWAIQLIWSKIWLDNFRYGPMEWIWRKLTYRSL